MLNINRLQNLEKEAESKKDYIDRHLPRVIVNQQSKSGKVIEVKVTVGDEYSHPDDLDHYIGNISLFKGQSKVGEAIFYSGCLGGQGSKGQQSVSFFILIEKTIKLTAQSYCTKHGIWESEPVTIVVI